MTTPTLRRVLRSAAAALVVGVGTLSLLAGFSDEPLVRLLQGIAVFAGGAVVLSAVVVLVLVRTANWRDPVSERDFDALVERTERLADGDSDPLDGDPDAFDGDSDALDAHADADAMAEARFRHILRAAVDELPLDFHRALEHVAIVVSDRGRRRGAYGLYEGDTVARDGFHDRIIIFRDTLERDFGHDPALLRAQIVRTLRHELAHHLGWDERGVRGLGL